MTVNFGQSLCLLQKNRNLDLHEVFSYSLRSYPRALASDSGGLNKTAKSKLLHVLESEANQPLVDVISQQCTTIIDAMALLQMLSVKDIPGTFAQLADQILKKIIHIARYNNSERVDFVSDRYPVVSTKNAERLNRAASGTQSVTILNGNQKVPRQWKKVKVLVKQWKLLPPFALEPLNKLFVTCSNYCVCFESEHDTIQVTEVEQLSSDHEEANVLTCTTCLCLHRKYSY